MSLVLTTASCIVLELEQKNHIFSKNLEECGESVKSGNFSLKKKYLFP